VLKVLITVDTEVWPNAANWPRTPLTPDRNCSRELACYFYGGEAKIKTGIPYQLDTLRRHGLKATFFVDPLFSYALGDTPLRELLELIVGQGQEIGLHLHPEWLTDPRCDGLPSFQGPFLWQYSDAGQRTLIEAGLQRQRTLGAAPVTAFRAGSWSADVGTLGALADNGIAFDTSLNPCFTASFPTLPRRESFVQPCKIGSVWEFPVSFFLDRPPAAKRPLHVCACSFSELRMVLDKARAAAWFAVVVVLHSFEFVRVDRLAQGKPATPQRLLARRFEKLCAYLASRPDEFETCFFRDLEPSDIPHDGPSAAIASSWARTSRRYVEQLASRFY